MKLLSLNGAALAAALAIGNGAAEAGIAYNTNGWDSGDFPGASGYLPGTWIGAAAPVYAGSLNTLWFADLSAGTTETVSSGGAAAAGADPAYELAVGPKGWWNGTPSTPTKGMGHGSDVGLIKLATASDLTITVRPTLGRRPMPPPSSNPASRCSGAGIADRPPTNCNLTCTTRTIRSVRPA
ncbi:hypothetical protein [Methylomonas koyamae]|uniref:hypothetical protein n=1 Tax=Methylomonas koyamae TaxID=702114 RepID=UPI000BDE759F|nr:hypothetical protein [Methylomonas koyamae]